MTTAARVCPVHAQPDADEAHAWPCPEDCPELLAELERRIEDVEIHGNFTQVTKGDDGRWLKQTFRNHQAVGEPMPWLINEPTPWLDQFDRKESS